MSFRAELRFKDCSLRPQVIKVGTSSLLRADMGSLNISNLARICETVRDLHRAGQILNHPPLTLLSISRQMDILPSRPRLQIAASEGTSIARHMESGCTVSQ